MLVVDDNEDAATSLAMLLGADGHTVQVAHDGRMRMEVGKTFAPDLVFLKGEHGKL